MFGHYCSLEMLTCWLHWLILLPTLAQWLFLLYAYLAFLNMYILIFVYLIHLGMIDSLCCITSCLSQHIVYYVIYLSCLSYFLPSLCVDISDILVICMTAWCITTLPLCDASIACLCGTHIYPFTSNSLVSVNFVSLDLLFDMRHVALFVLQPS